VLLFDTLRVLRRVGPQRNERASMQVSTASTRSNRVDALSPTPLPSQVKSLSRNTSFSGNLKGAKSVTDIEQIQHALDPSDDRQVIRLPRPCSRQNNASRSDMPRSVSFSNEEGRHRQCARGLKSGPGGHCNSPIDSPAMGLSLPLTPAPTHLQPAQAPAHVIAGKLTKR